VKKRILQALVIGWACLASGLLVALVYAHRSFKKNADQLIELKEDYNAYVLALKRALLECEANSEAEESAEEEKKKRKMRTGKLTNSQFVVLNRDIDYLREEARQFAKKYNLEDEVVALYQKPIIQSGKRSKRSRRPVRASSSNARRKQRAMTTRLHQETGQKGSWPAVDVQFAWPIDKRHFRISSPFGPRRRPRGFHYGIDLAACKGTPVLAAADGVVVEAHMHRGYGNTIVVAHGRTCSTRYAHLSRILVTVGDKVKAGQLIGKVGATGHVYWGKSTKDPSHLHFEIMIFGKRVNPLYYLH
jgi:murein DD-endopeptidase MepM/ murein hydrolase activator NlpD